MSAKGLELVQRLRDEVVVGDGATGTMLWSRGLPLDSVLERANVSQPDLVKAVHLEYIAAGSEIVESNTFGANRVKLSASGLGDQTVEINAAGVRLMKSVVPDHVAIAGAIGPLGRFDVEEQVSEAERAEAYHEQAFVLLSEGVDLLVLETFAHAEELQLALEAIRKLDSSVPVICQMAFSDAAVRPGNDVARGLIGLTERGASVIGGNCGAGPLGLYRVVKEIAQYTAAPLSALPNASLPDYVNGRYIYRTDPQYFAESAERLVEAGANLVGGCCGTSPEHIRAVVERLRGKRPVPRAPRPLPTPARRPRKRVRKPRVYSPIERIRADRKIALVEVKPPRGLAMGAVRRAAQLLKEAGVDGYSLVENSLAQVRMSPFALAHLLQEEFEVACVCHCTCRDRNLMGQYSELAGAVALGIRTVLALTGDPATMGDSSGSSSVYDTNSLGLIEILSDMNKGLNVAGNEVSGEAGFVIGAALDPNVRRLDPAVRRLEKKIERGARFVMTQPVFDRSLLEELYQATAHLGVPVILGVMPLVSYRNAAFLHNEVPGIRIPDDVLERMRGASHERAQDVGLAIARELVDEASEYAPGFYIMPQLEKYEVAADLVRHVKSVVSVVH